MCRGYNLCSPSILIAEIGEGYSWFATTAVSETNKLINNKQYNIIRRSLISSF